MKEAHCTDTRPPRVPPEAVVIVYVRAYVHASVRAFVRVYVLMCLCVFFATSHGYNATSVTRLEIIKLCHILIL